MSFIPKLFINGSAYKVIITDRSCSELCLSNQLSINEISESEGIPANKVKYSITQSLKTIANSLNEKEKIEIMNLIQ